MVAGDDTITYVLEHSGAKLVLTSPETEAQLPGTVLRRRRKGRRRTLAVQPHRRGVSHDGRAMPQAYPAAGRHQVRRTGS